MIDQLLSKLREYRAKRHIGRLVKMGLRIGRGTDILSGAFLDPSHCFLISIGGNCNIAPNVRLIAHDASMLWHLEAARLGRITIHDNCFIGDSAIVLPGVTIGPDSIVGAGSVVTKDVPPRSVAAGNPARVISSLDDFLEKHRQGLEGARCFPIGEYDVSVISEEKKSEMISCLEGRTGYMKGIL